MPSRAELTWCPASRAMASESTGLHLDGQPGRSALIAARCRRWFPPPADGDESRHPRGPVTWRRIFHADGVLPGDDLPGSSKGCTIGQVTLGCGVGTGWSRAGRSSTLAACEYLELWCGRQRHDDDGVSRARMAARATLRGAPMADGDTPAAWARGLSCHRRRHGILNENTSPNLSFFKN